ncbi:hypothetical protein A2U01_0102814, partial [Trifolium medium]|nr:hypothetical protein [Trifolium medium]
TGSEEAEEQGNHICESGVGRTRRRKRDLGIGEQDEGFLSRVVFR